MQKNAHNRRLEIRSILIVSFLSEFNSLEKLIRSIFEKEIISVDHRLKSKLYFLYGSTIGSEIYYNLEDNCLDLSSKRNYNDKELFKKLAINKLIKFDKKEKIISKFAFSVDSIQTRLTQYDFYHILDKLINMRNTLAHDTESLKTSPKYVIEILSNEHLQRYLFPPLGDGDLSLMDDGDLSLLSNIIYLDIIKDRLNKA